MEQNNQLPPDGGRSYIKFLVVFVVIVAAALGGYWSWEKAAKGESGIEQSVKSWMDYRRAEKFWKTLDDALASDTYGGKTPEETLRMFIDALKNGDLDLASKYFALETNVNDPNYLTRKILEDALLQARQEGRIEEIVVKLEQVAVSAKSEKRSTFESNNSDNAGVLVEINLNEKSGVWKIESL